MDTRRSLGIIYSIWLRSSEETARDMIGVGFVSCGEIKYTLMQNETVRLSSEACAYSLQRRYYFSSWTIAFKIT